MKACSEHDKISVHSIMLSLIFDVQDIPLFPCLKFNNLARLTKQSTIIMLIREMRPFGEKPALGMFHSSSRPAARLQGSKLKGHMNPEHWRLVWGCIIRPHTRPCQSTFPVQDLEDLEDLDVFRQALFSSICSSHLWLQTERSMAGLEGFARGENYASMHRSSSSSRCLIPPKRSRTPPTYRWSLTCGP